MQESAETQKKTNSSEANTTSGGWGAFLLDWFFLPILVVALALDQLTKYLVKTNFALGESWPADGFIRLTYTTNSGTAFGLFPNQTFLLTVASFFAIGFLVYFYRKHAIEKRILRFAIGLQLGGAFGNLIDRVAFGKVVDFIDVGPWPNFNIADSSIVVGMAILVIFLLFLDDSRTPSKDSEPASASDGDAS